METAGWVVWVVVAVLVAAGFYGVRRHRKSKGGSGRAVGPDQGDSRRQK